MCNFPKNPHVCWLVGRSIMRLVKFHKTREVTPYAPMEAPLFSPSFTLLKTSLATSVKMVFEVYIFFSFTIYTAPGLLRHPFDIIALVNNATYFLQGNTVCL